jgi:hypothetical protein
MGRAGWLPEADDDARDRPFTGFYLPSGDDGGRQLLCARSFLPSNGSRAFDTAKYIRCIDMGLTESEDGTVLTRCANGQVCRPAASGILPPSF